MVRALMTGCLLTGLAGLPACYRSAVLANDTVEYGVVDATLGCRRQGCTNGNVCDPDSNRCVDEATYLKNKARASR